MNKQKKHWPHFTPSWGSPPWTDRHAIRDTVWRLRRNHPCQILFQSVKWFLRGSTPKSAISYTSLNDPYNSSALLCRLWLASYLVPFRSYRSLLFKFHTLCVFEPPFGELRDNVRCSSWAHWKVRTTHWIVDFLLVLIEVEWRDGESANSLHAVTLMQNFRQKGSPTTNHFCMVS